MPFSGRYHIFIRSSSRKISARSLSSSIILRTALSFCSRSFERAFAAASSPNTSPVPPAPEKAGASAAVPYNPAALSAEKHSAEIFCLLASATSSGIFAARIYSACGAVPPSAEARRYISTARFCVMLTHSSCQMFFSENARHVSAMRRVCAKLS